MFAQRAKKVDYGISLQFSGKPRGNVEQRKCLLIVKFCSLNVVQKKALTSFGNNRDPELDYVARINVVGHICYELLLIEKCAMHRGVILQENPWSVILTKLATR